MSLKWGGIVGRVLSEDSAATRKQSTLTIKPLDSMLWECPF